MAKARRPPFAAAERFLGFPRGGSSSGAVAPAPASFDDLPDLAEADVWYSGASAAGGDSGSPYPAASRQQVEVAAEGRSGGQRAPSRRGVQGGLSQAFGDGNDGGSAGVRDRRGLRSLPIAGVFWSPSS